jgi:hypothetical protein
MKLRKKSCVQNRVQLALLSEVRGVEPGSVIIITKNGWLTIPAVAGGFCNGIELRS